MDTFVQIVLTVIASGFGAWLSVRFFPLKAKQDEWLWEKRIGSQEFLFDRLSKIVFLSHNYLRSEFEGYSMAGMSADDLESTIFKSVREIHERSASLGLFLNRTQKGFLEAFLSDSHEVMDEASETWGMWNAEDGSAEMRHRSDTLGKIYQASVDCLDQLKAHMDVASE